MHQGCRQVEAGTEGGCLISERKGDSKTSDAEGITTGGPCPCLDRVRVVRGAVVHLTCPVHSTYLYVCRFTMCGPHASRIVWPAFTPACKPALASVRSVPSVRPFRQELPIPGRPRACLPRLPDSLQPFPPVSPEQGGASRLPRPNNDGSSRPHSRPHRPPKLAPQTGFLLRRRRGLSLPSPCARLPSLGPRMYP